MKFAKPLGVVALSTVAALAAGLWAGNSLTVKSDLCAISMNEASTVVGGAIASCTGCPTEYSGIYGCTRTGCTKVKNSKCVDNPPAGPDTIVALDCNYNSGGVTVTCGTTLQATPKCATATTTIAE